MSAPNWARPDARCVCVNASKTWKHIATGTILFNGPKRGNLLVVERVRIYENGMYLKFAEWHGMFPVDCFRPLIKRTQKQDVALFRHLLTKTPTPATV